ncbi:glucose 1-dehydrogenase [Streptomyces sp. e14]|uniref:glucose 1-dehydrogenase n=1 Tax=Streptomyces sp. e14 TaxID=645465 RepID=UPI0002EDCF67|nr:glucose 1-dehydrogenase [Streptomyces sp. e14]
MKAITVVPGEPGRVRVEEVPEPAEREGSLLVEGRLLGICGTDVDIVERGYGWLPPGQDRLVIGHESLGAVLEAPPDSGFAPGDHVVGIVRRPDPEPCDPCSQGEWDFCRNGGYTERGIKERNGYGSRHWRVEPEFAVRVDPGLGDCGVLLEPASVLAKAWEQTDHIFARSSWRPRIALVTGAGPIGLLAALMGVQRGLEVHVLDREDRPPKSTLARDVGAVFHTGDVRSAGVAPDVVIECTGHGPLVFEVTKAATPNSVVCLTGISGGSAPARVSTDEANNHLVLGNTVVFGTVNAARRHYEQAARALAAADRAWLDRLITRKVPMDDYAQALRKNPDDVKVVVDLRT